MKPSKGSIIVNLYIGRDGARQLDFLKIGEGVSKLPDCPLSLAGYESPHDSTVCVDDSTVARIDDTVYFIYPMYWRLLETESDYLPMNQIIHTFVASKTVLRGLFAPDEGSVLTVKILESITSQNLSKVLPTDEQPYSQCVVGKYLFLETSCQSTARLKINTRVYQLKNENSEPVWERLMLSNEVETFLSAKPMSIAPQTLRSDTNKIIYLQEHSTGQFTVAKSVRIYVIDFDRQLVKRVFKYDYDDEFRQCYLSGNNFVVHR